MSNTLFPDFKIDINKIPEVKIKSIRFQNFKAFEDANFDFTDNGECKPFICFHGPNGTGKSTILDTITLIFSRLEGRDIDKLRALLGKSVRHVDGSQKAMYNKEDDFLITANLHSSLGDYEIQINKTGFIKDHPAEIKEIVYRLCFYARFDQELNQFQLNREQWPLFKDLFESVTGFEIKEKEGVFNESSDPIQAEILKKYVLGFWVHKEDEIISHKECSAGERKVIKSFSTLLNKEYRPSVVCIDNAEMHVEAGRHIDLIESMKKCFPTSQIFASTHSYQISKNFGNKKQLYDLRMLKSPELIKNNPWRLYLSDEVKEGVSKLESTTTNKEMVDSYMAYGNALIKRCFTDTDESDLMENSEDFLKKVEKFYLQDLISNYKKGI